MHRITVAAAVLLFSSLGAGTGSAAPIGATATIEIREGAASIAGVSLHSSASLGSISVGAFGPGGAFAITQTVWGTDVGLAAFGGGANLFPGSFGPGLVGAGFGGIAPLDGSSGELFFDDGLGFVDIEDRHNFRFFGRTDSGFLFDTFGSTEGFYSRGPWTTNTVVITGSHPVAGGAFSTQLAGYDLRTAGGVGILQMVSPIKLTAADESGPPHALTWDYPLYAVMTIEFVPEPGGLMLLALGSLGLAGVAAQRRRSRRS